jgi:hypothetical protein
LLNIVLRLFVQLGRKRAVFTLSGIGATADSFLDNRRPFIFECSASLALVLCSGKASFRVGI